MDLKLILKTMLPVIKTQIKTVKVNALSVDIDFILKDGSIYKFIDKDLREILSELCGQENI